MPNSSDTNLAKPASTASVAEDHLEFAQDFLDAVLGSSPPVDGIGDARRSEAAVAIPSGRPGLRDSGVDDSTDMASPANLICQAHRKLWLALMAMLAALVLVRASAVTRFDLRTAGFVILVAAMLWCLQFIRLTRQFHKQR